MRVSHLKEMMLLRSKFTSLYCTALTNNALSGFLNNRQNPHLEWCFVYHVAVWNKSSIVILFRSKTRHSLPMLPLTTLTTLRLTCPSLISAKFASSPSPDKKMLASGATRTLYSGGGHLKRMSSALLMSTRFPRVMDSFVALDKNITWSREDWLNGWMMGRSQVRSR